MFAELILWAIGAGLAFFALLLNNVLYGIPAFVFIGLAVLRAVK